MIKRPKRIAAFTLVAASITGASVVGSAAPAEAALPACRALSSFYRFPAGGTAHTWDVPTITANDQNINCALRQGDVGAPVMVLQAALIDCYGQTIRADAIYGPQTAAAVRAVQTWENARRGGGDIAVDGMFGPATSRRMMWRTRWGGWGPAAPVRCVYPSW